MKTQNYLLITIFCLIFTGSNAQWEWQYPVPQGNELNDMFFINPETGWAVGDAGTIIRSEDGGLSYGVINYPTFNDLRSVEFPDLLSGFAVGDSGLILKTSDGGNTWIALESGLNENLTDVCILPPLIWVTGDNGTVLHSNDQGLSWQTQFTDTSLTLYNVCFVDNAQGWAAGSNTTDGHLLLHTMDGGTSWSQIYSNNPGPYESHRWNANFYDTLNGYGCSNEQIKKTTDGGITWEVIFNAGQFYDLYFTDAMFLDPDHGWITYGCVGPSGSWGLIYSHDGFETWNWGESGIRCTNVYFIDTLQGWTSGKNGSLAKTTDGGTTWTVIAANSSNAWLRDVFFSSATDGWAVGGYAPTYTQSFSSILHTQNGGDSWTYQTIQPADLTSVFFINSSVGWIGGNTWSNNSFYLFHTSDGGVSWEAAYTENINMTVKDILFTDDMHGWVVGGGAFNYFPPSGPPIFLFTENGGESWMDLSYLTDQSLSAICFTGADTGWIAGNGIILHTTDGGQNWGTLWTGNYSLTDICFADNAHGWAIGDSTINKGMAMRTSNGGVTWEVTSFDHWGQLTKVCFTDHLRGWIAGTYNNHHGVLLHTNDGGVSWAQQFINTKHRMRGMFFLDHDKGWLVGDKNAILYTKNASTLSIEEKQPLCKDATLRLKSYPNPLSGQTTIEYSLQKAGMVTLCIYNQLGEQVEILVPGHKQKGTHQFSWNAPDLPPGLYLLRLQAGNEVRTEKVIKR